MTGSELNSVKRDMLDILDDLPKLTEDDLHKLGHHGRLCSRDRDLILVRYYSWQA